MSFPVCILPLFWGPWSWLQFLIQFLMLFERNRARCKQSTAQCAPHIALFLYCRSCRWPLWGVTPISTLELLAEKEKSGCQERCDILAGFNVKSHPDSGILIGIRVVDFFFLSSPSKNYDQMSPSDEPAALLWGRWAVCLPGVLWVWIVWYDCVCFSIGEAVCFLRRDFPFTQHNCQSPLLKSKIHPCSTLSIHDSFTRARATFYYPHCSGGESEGPMGVAPAFELLNEKVKTWAQVCGLMLTVTCWHALVRQSQGVHHHAGSPAFMYKP